MTLQQGLAIAIVLGAMVLFVWGRLRYDLVALLALVVSVAVGLVPPAKAFEGFSDDVVVIVASALLISAAIARSGVVEQVLARAGPWLATPRMQVFVLVTIVTALSAFVKNIGALAMLIPAALQIGRKTGTSPSSLLMPMAFGSLLGGLVTLVGTSPNILASRVREEIVGEPFRMFDFAPTGLGIAAAGIVFLTFGYRLLPGGRKSTASLETALTVDAYVTEARVPEGPLVGMSVGELEALSDKAVEVTAVVRDRHRRFLPGPEWKLAADDIVLLRGEPTDLDQLVARANLALIKASKHEPDETPNETMIIEAVVTGDSPLMNRTAKEMRIHERHNVTLLAVSRRGERVTQRLRALKLRSGDVVVVRGEPESLPEALPELGLLPLAEREIRLGRSRRRFLPPLVLVAAMLLIGLGLVPVAIGFFGAAVLLVALRTLTPREAYGALDGPILVLLAALIPVSDTLRTTGATELLASGLSSVAIAIPPLAAVALVMVAAMAVTPFLNNAATVLVMGPIAAGVAAHLGYRPEAFLMAVAIGAACDFLTPIGHQCNTLVMGPGGYRFGDYWKLGLPLSILVVVVGVPLIGLVWPLAPR